MEQLHIEDIIRLIRLVPPSSWIHVQQVEDYYTEEYIGQICETNIRFRQKQKADAPFSQQYYVYGVSVESARCSHYLGGDSTDSRNYEGSRNDPKTKIFERLYYEIVHKKGSPEENPKSFTREEAIKNIRALLDNSSITLG